MGAYRFAIRMLNLKLHKPHNVLITVSLLFGLVFYSTILLLSISVLYNKEVMMGLNYSPVFPLDENQFGDLSSSTLNRALERVKKKISAAMFPGVDNFSSYTINQFDLKPLNNVAPIMKKGLGPIYNDVTFFEYPISIENCSQSYDITTNGSLFVAVISAPEFFQKRQTIRNTWARLLTLQSAFFNLRGFAFIVGRSTNQSIEKRLKEESFQYGDLIQVDITDNYYNLTLKVAGFLNWIYINCGKVDFVLKADDDVYVNVRNLATMLSTLPDPGLHQNIYGTKMQELVVHPRWPRIKTSSRIKNDILSMSYEAWPWLTYPNFLVGSCIVLSGSAIAPLLAGFQVTPYIPFDDVYLTGLVTRRVNSSIRVLSSEKFVKNFPTYSIGSCFVFESVSWMTQTNDEMHYSHLRTEQFYGGMKPCILDNKDGRKTIINSMEDVNYMDFLVVPPVPSFSP